MGSELSTTLLFYSKALFIPIAAPKLFLVNQQAGCV